MWLACMFTGNRRAELSAEVTRRRAAGEKGPIVTPDGTTISKGWKTNGDAGESLLLDDDDDDNRGLRLSSISSSRCSSSCCSSSSSSSSSSKHSCIGEHGLTIMPFLSSFS